MPKVVQAELNEFVDYFNHKKPRAQKNKWLPDHVAPQVIFDHPKDYGLENLKIDVTQEVIDILCSEIQTPREEAFRWVSDEFDELAFKVYQDLGAPTLRLLNAWNVFNQIVKYIEEIPH